MRAELELDEFAKATPRDTAATPSGCRFYPRCRYAEDICRTEEPPLVDKTGREVACKFEPRRFRLQPVNLPQLFRSPAATPTWSSKF
ncbi:hypothetical protein [Fodinicola acaciae]|uniref:ABC transporter ATP-binding protein n=1 Tax=Fodinicola acaciae TaxID=2681555 RepID=UPI001FE43B62|nr:hypothetical protein [Fodinicola acaciae]